MNVSTWMNKTTTKVVYDHDFHYSLELERKFNGVEFLSSMRNQWHHSVTIATIYVFLVYLLRKYMDSRPKFELRYPLVIWNFSLAVFSIYGSFFRFIPEIYYCLKTFGFQYSVCDNSGKSSGVIMFWIYLFTFSKVVELGDTAFIVLRKQNLIFLHWYHHITVLINVWFSIAQANASGRWFIAVNFTVHAFMYTYYFFKALKFRVPKFISAFVTSLQLIQMLIGCYVNYTCFSALRNKEPCDATMDNIRFSVLIYFSYLILFGSFFWKSYISGAKLNRKKVE